MTAILGISAFYHDSAAALVVEGNIVAAAQEERFTRKKHDAGFPANAAAYCLKEGGIQLGQLDYVVFYEKPLAKFDRLLETYVAYAPAGFRSFQLAMPIWLKDKLHMRRILHRHLGRVSRARLVFTDHHESHAASAFYPSPFDEAAFLTMDGVGEWSTATLGKGEGNKLSFLRQLRFPHSLGLLYSAFCYYCGFKVNSGEYKLMGLAPYGQPAYSEAILKNLIDLKADGSFRMDLEYFNYCQGLTMTSEKFHRLFGGPPRRPESVLEQRHMDIAASIQRVTEEIVMRMAREAHRESFRPFAPAVLRERVSEFFGLRPDQESPYMLLVAPVLEQHRRRMAPAELEKMSISPDLRERVNLKRSTLPAITHVDYSARIQTVDAERHGRFYRLIKAFERLTGCPAIVNTSFNIRGEPIVCTPSEAYRCFLATDMDVLVLEDFLLLKEKMKTEISQVEREEYLAGFKLD